MEHICKVKEIFESIQGEGLYIGEKHLFVRFTGCNLNCGFCDTDFSDGENVFKFNSEELFDKIKNSSAQTVSFTGGEPLLHAEFLRQFLTEFKHPLKKKIYLETNGTLPYQLRQVIDFIDVVSMDIKLKSATGEKNEFRLNDEFLLVAKDKEAFVKIVFDSNITDAEIEHVCELLQKHQVPLVLQPKMPLEKNCNVEEIFEKFYQKYQYTRLIPQVHKFLNLA